MSASSYYVVNCTPAPVRGVMPSGWVWTLAPGQRARVDGTNCDAISWQIGSNSPAMTVPEASGEWALVGDGSDGIHAIPNGTPWSSYVFGFAAVLVGPLALWWVARKISRMIAPGWEP